MTNKLRHISPTVFSKASERFLDLLFPSKCIGCGKEGIVICSSCADTFIRVKRPYCEKCGLPLKTEAACPKCRKWPLKIERIRSVFIYEGLARDAVHAFKYNNLKLLSKPLARLMADYLNADPMPADVLVPVPIHPRRMRQRGYNQAELLATELSKILEIPVWRKALVRISNTPSQISLKAEQRRRNVSNAFKCRDQGIEGRSVLLIDDVCTTGATLNACAVALYKTKAASVRGLTLTRE